MKITILSYVFPHPTRGYNPGIERVVAEEAFALADLGHEVILITSFRNGQAAIEEVYRGLTIYRVRDLRDRLGKLSGVAAMEFVSLSRTIQQRFRLLLENSDVVHTFTPLHKWPYTTPLFSHYHHFDKPATVIEMLYAPALTQLWRKTYQMSSKVLAVSAFSANEFHTIHPEVTTPVEVVYNGVDAARFCCSARNWAEAKPTLLYVGPLIKRKGLDYLIQSLPAVVSKIPDVHLRIVGHGSELARLERMSEDLGVRQAVTFYGFVSDDELKDHYAQSSVFVFPSLNEGFGIVVAEAMAAGLPVIVADAPAVMEIVADAGIVVPKCDSRAISKAILSLFGKSNNLKKISMMGQARVENHFTWKSSAATLESIYMRSLKDDYAQQA